MTIEVDEYGLASASAYCSLFDCQVTVQLFTDLEADAVTETMRACVRDLEALGPEHRDAVARMLFEHAEMCFESTSYGHVWTPSVENETEANRSAFGVRSPDDALHAAALSSAHVDAAHDGFAHRYIVLVFDVLWEEEHGCGVALRDGVPVGWGSADLFVGAFEG